MTNEIPDIVIGRLPIYLRALKRIQDENEKQNTSSHELGRRLGISSAQIRKDLSHFGEFGKQGTGYHIAYLIEQLEEILHLNYEWPIVMVGAGHIGHALANYNGFQDRGFHISWIFDSDPNKIGTKINQLIVQDISELEETIHQNQAEMAIVAVPASVAQSITDRLISAGIKTILSYAPIHLVVPDDVQINYNDPVTQLQRMTYYLTPKAEPTLS